MTAVRVPVRRSQRGQAMVEQLVTWTVLALLTFGIFQVGLIYKAKLTFNDAVFKGAREGSLRNANKDAMRSKIAESLGPLYMGSGGGIDRYSAAVARSLAENYYMGADLGGVRVNVLNPTREIFNIFAIRQYDLVECGTGATFNMIFVGACQNNLREARIRQIPNDNLPGRWSSTNYLNVFTRGQTVQMNLQDANLLKIQAHWCYGMEVPFVNRLIHSTLALLPGDKGPHWNACMARTSLDQASGGWTRLYIPVSSDVIIRMESPVRCVDQNCTNLSG